MIKLESLLNEVLPALIPEYPVNIAGQHLKLRFDVNVNKTKKGIKLQFVLNEVPQDPRALQNISPNLSHNAKHYNIGSTAKGSSDNPINFQINNDLKVIKVPTNDSIEVQNAPDFSGVNNFEVLKDQDRKDWEKDVEDNQIVFIFFSIT